jgi:hypothetical protein
MSEAETAGYPSATSILREAEQDYEGGRVEAKRLIASSNTARLFVVASAYSTGVLAITEEDKLLDEEEVVKMRNLKRLMKILNQLDFEYKIVTCGRLCGIASTVEISEATFDAAMKWCANPNDNAWAQRL